MAAKITTGGKKKTSLMFSTNALIAALSMFNGTNWSSVSPKAGCSDETFCNGTIMVHRWSFDSRVAYRKRHSRGETATSTTGGNVTQTEGVCLGQDAAVIH